MVLYYPGGCQVGEETAYQGGKLYLPIRRQSLEAIISIPIRTPQDKFSLWANLARLTQLKQIELEIEPPLVIFPKLAIAVQ